RTAKSWLAKEYLSDSDCLVEDCIEKFLIANRRSVYRIFTIELRCATRTRFSTFTTRGQSAFFGLPEAAFPTAFV
ncbi:MAG: hypothetical protein AAF202_09470, partial [Pseudomonadota bacterium]